MSSFFPSPFVLVFGETGALLYGEETPLVFEERSLAARATLQETLRAAPKRPLLLVLDSLSLSLASTDLPPLNRRDRLHLLKRRADAFFPDTLFRATQAQTTKRGLLIGVHASDALRFWQDSAEDLPNPHLGLALLPLLTPKLIERLAPGQGWRLVLSLERAGGCRQTVLRDGQILFTRQTPLPLPQTSASFAAASLACDLQATRLFLARFGLTSETPLDLVAILPSELHHPLAAAAKDTAQGRFFTPEQAAQKCDLAPEATHPHFADSLFAALAARPLPRLRFFTPQERARKASAKRRRWARGVLLILFAALLGLMAHDAFSWFEAHRTNATLAASLREAETERAETLRDGSRENEAFRRALTAVARDRLLRGEAANPWEVLDRLAPALATDPRLLRFEAQTEGQKQTIHLHVRFQDSPGATPAERAEALQQTWNVSPCTAILAHAPTERISTEAAEANETAREADFVLTCEAKP